MGVQVAMRALRAVVKRAQRGKKKAKEEKVHGPGWEAGLASCGRYASIQSPHVVISFMVPPTHAGGCWSCRQKGRGVPQVSPARGSSGGNLLNPLTLMGGGCVRIPP